MSCSINPERFKSGVKHTIGIGLILKIKLLDVLPSELSLMKREFKDVYPANHLNLLKLWRDLFLIHCRFRGIIHRILYMLNHSF